MPGIPEGATPGAPEGAKPGALTGLRVLDISTLFAAPQVGAALGDLGADVVVVEPPGGDPLRSLGAAREGHSLMWAMVARNKRSICLDFDSDDGRTLLRKLADRADVLIENQPRAALLRWGMTWEELSTRSPRLIMVSVSAFGRSGPYRDRVGAGTLGEAFAGLTHMTGEADGPPMLTSLPIGDVLAATAGVVGALAALYHRDARNGSGQHVDVSLYEPVLQLLAGSVAGLAEGGAPPRRLGSRIEGGVPRNVYRCADDHWVAVSATTDTQVSRVLTRIGRDAESDRARFGTSAKRIEAADELDACVADWIRARSRDEVLELLENSRIPAAPVNDLYDIMRDPHVRDRQSFTTLYDDALGALTLVSPTPKLGATPGRILHVGPALGENGREVCAEWLEMQTDEVERLEALGALRAVKTP